VARLHAAALPGSTLRQHWARKGRHVDPIGLCGSMERLRAGMPRFDLLRASLGGRSAPILGFRSDFCHDDDMSGA
jgi:hypothetical protein